jgi:predicted DsbA family dithiol-disulfide isomerase
MRKSVFFLAALALGVAPTLGLAQQSSLGNSNVVAEVNGQKLTTSDLEQQEGSRLLQARSSFYDAQRKALDDLIDQRLLEQEAAKEHVTVDQLLDREVKSKLPADPTEDQLKVSYEIVDTDQPYDAVRDKIVQHIRDTRFNRAKAAYLVKLRAQSNILITLQPPSANVNLANSVLKGNPNAQVVLVEFADYQCPYCQKVHPDIAKLQQEFGDKLAVAFKDFPLPMHPYAEKAAEAARCAGAQGKFWEFHDALFTDKKLEVPQLKDQAKSLKLDSAAFDKCLDSGEQAAAVQRDYAEGKKLGITGTPSFFVNGHYFSGAVNYTMLRDMVHQQLSAPSTSLSSNKGNPPMESSLR